jgi:uncharacterized protein YrrD
MGASSTLMRAREIIKRPVVTLSGDDVAQIKDIVYAGDHGEIAGFTLAGRGLFAGPKKDALLWTSVHALGRDAVMIVDETVFTPRKELLDRSDARSGDVLADRVLTDTGTDLGQVTDVIIEIGAKADVVGYEIDSTDALGKNGRSVLIPLPDTISVSGEALIVPATAADFVSEDLSGFGAAVDAFRSRLRGQ